MNTENVKETKKMHTHLRKMEIRKSVWTSLVCASPLQKRGAALPNWALRRYHGDAFPKL